jgi:hypothetical protein
MFSPQTFSAFCFYSNQCQCIRGCPEVIFTGDKPTLPYDIFDATDARGYVGAAYGADNVLGRWLNYSAIGHGGNSLL